VFNVQSPAFGGIKKLARNVGLVKSFFSRIYGGKQTMPVERNAEIDLTRISAGLPSHAGIRVVARPPACRLPLIRALHNLAAGLSSRIRQNKLRLTEVFAGLKWLPSTRSGTFLEENLKKK